jgi:hypothetical protein
MINSQGCGIKDSKTQSQILSCLSFEKDLSLLAEEHGIVPAMHKAPKKSNLSREEIKYDSLSMLGTRIGLSSVVGGDFAGKSDKHAHQSQSSDPSKTSPVLCRSRKPFPLISLFRAQRLLKVDCL